MKLPLGDRHDALIVGGGPAGLSAAIALARARRSVVLFESPRPGRSSWSQLNHNYLGFPDGISIVDLCARGRAQAERFGVHIQEAVVDTVTHDEYGFAVTSAGTTHQGRGLILATGVTDKWVQFPGYEDYIGKTMHWCITCDGYEMRDQRVLVVGNDAETVELALEMLRFNPKTVTVLTNSQRVGVPLDQLEELQSHGIEIVVDRIVRARSRTIGCFEAVLLAGGREIPLDHLFSSQGAEPNAALARSLGVELTEDGHIKVDAEAKTSVAGVYAAGDVTSLHSHQVQTAAHEGATAAASLVYALYQQDKETLHAERLAHTTG
ncbi:MAG TPA: NAD(P)/FAD-dependent oxidoreductase [Thermomicrobiales bacterium]|jgi:thioredoxin reductase (NADPH)|nr:NAD(P)/FAD-dependent oxidoreductase [Thermomicrobiales bacterium]